MVTVISTFAGCGGSSLGYKLAGFKELLAIDYDNNAEATFKANFPEVPFWNKDIRKVNVQEILDFTQLKIGELDVLDGSPPCQGFSTAGKRQVIDPRNDLFKDFIRLIEGLQPKVFVMENVSGMIKGTMKGKFKEIIVTLKNLGYNVKCKLLNAKYYQVPQSRQRLFFIGVRKDLNKEPVFPTPSTKIITVNEALRDLEQLNLKNTEITNQIIKKGYYQIPQGKNGESLVKGSYFNTIRIHPSKPCPTITKIRGLLHYVEPRYLTIPELKRLSSFPDDFQFIGGMLNQWARIGNAVMPNQMKAIAKTIKSQIL